MWPTPVFNIMCSFILLKHIDKEILWYFACRPVRTMTAESPLTSIDVMHDGATLAVGSTRGKIYIYDLRKGTEPVKTVTAHTGAIQCLAFQYRASKVRRLISLGTTVHNYWYNSINGQESSLFYLRPCLCIIFESTLTFPIKMT